MATATRCHPPLSKFEIIRGVKLPSISILDQIQAVQKHYFAVTGRLMEIMTAVSLLDRVLAERRAAEVNCYDPEPIAEHLAEVCDYLHRASYNDETIYLTAKHIERRGIDGLTVFVDGCDAEGVRMILEGCTADI